jgi:hypothetical protein
MLAIQMLPVVSGFANDEFEMACELLRSIYGAVVACRRKNRGRARVAQDFEPGFSHVRSGIDKCAPQCSV